VAKFTFFLAVVAERESEFLAVFFVGVSEKPTPESGVLMVNVW
jgi:hypothetical protein